jgi:hypothetical protein
MLDRDASDRAARAGLPAGDSSIILESLHSLRHVDRPALCRTTRLRHGKERNGFRPIPEEPHFQHALEEIATCQELSWMIRPNPPASPDLSSPIAGSSSAL